MSKPKLKIGDRVRVKPGVLPAHAWGEHVTPDSVGTLASAGTGIWLVDFPGHPGWMSFESELELVAYGNEEED